MKVSVLMPVYNGEKYLKEALESILKQTFKVFELVIVNDGSTDRSMEIINNYRDPRIKIVTKPNSGIVDSLNLGISKARGEYIARMDADDISTPVRLIRQVQFLDKHPEISLVGTTARVIREDGSFSHVNTVLTEDEDIRKAFLVGNMFVHGSTMFRKEILKRSGVYDKKSLHSEDYDLWVRIAYVSKVANLTESLYWWRNNSGGVSQRNITIQNKSAEEIRRQYWEKIEKNGNLPLPSITKTMSRKDFYLSRKDNYKDSRVKILAYVSSKYSRHLWLLGRKKEALIELWASILVTPRSPQTYLAIITMTAGENVSIVVEKALRRLLLVLSNSAKFLGHFSGK